MTWVTELIENLPQIVEAIAPGFLMVATFSWTASKKYENAATVITLSIVLSYLIRQVGLIFIEKETTRYMLVVCLLSAIIGFLSAIFYKSQKVNLFISNIGVKRTTNDVIWDDVIGDKAWVAIFNSDGNEYYCGVFRFQSYENDHSYVVISPYYVADSDGKLTTSYIEDLDRSLMFNPDDYKSIIISKKDPFGYYEI